MYSGVLFDWDGTLADTRKVILKSFQQALKTVVNVETDPEFIERQIGTGAAQTFQTILTKAGKPHDDKTVGQLIAEKVQAEIALTSQVKLFPGARELLEALQGKVKLALASMNNRAVIEDLLHALEIENCFDTVAAVEEVKRFKPDPEIFLKAAEKLQLNPPECVVVEDSIFGVQAAKNAGIACIAVLTGVYKKAELEQASPDLIVNSLCELEKILTLIQR